MSALVLELRQNDMLLVNGARMVAQAKSRIALQTHARFVFGKQYMPQEAATTPATRFYFAVQQAYAGGEALDVAAIAGAVLAFQDEASAQLLVDAGRWAVDTAYAAEAGDGYAALRAARKVVEAEGTTWR
jgi:flagellar protein FlbT